jgi:hypothetical protein
MIAGMQLPQSMAAAQHRTATMAGLQTRSAMPKGGRPEPAPNQMMAGGAVRVQGGGQQLPAAYRRTARNLPPNVIFILYLKRKTNISSYFRMQVDFLIQ